MGRRLGWRVSSPWHRAGAGAATASGPWCSAWAWVSPGSSVGGGTVAGAGDRRAVAREPPGGAEAERERGHAGDGGGGRGAGADRARAARRRRPQRQRDGRPGAAPPSARSTASPALAREPLGAIADDRPRGARRDAPAARRPAPSDDAAASSRRSRGSAELDALVEQCASAGLPVDARRRGRAARAARRRRPAAYRIVQEALTNVAQARRAAPARRAPCATRRDALERRGARRRRRPGAPTRRPAATGWSACASGSRSRRRARRRPRAPAAASRCAPVLPIAVRAGVHPRADRRRPGAGPRRLPADPRGAARHRGRRRGRATASRPSSSRAGCEPDVVLMDIRMPRHRRHRGDPPASPRADRRRAVLILTTFDLDEYVYRGAARRRQRLPAQGRPARASWSRAVRVVAAGDALLAPAITRRLIERVRPARRPAPTPPAALAELTAREREVLRAARARPVQRRDRRRRWSSARRRSRPTSPASCTKLGLRDRVQAVVLAYETGLVQPGGRG